MKVKIQLPHFQQSAEGYCLPACVRFWLHDPALSTGPIAVSWHSVLAAWAEFGYRGAALSYGQGKCDDER